MKKVGIILVNYKDYARNYLSACRDSLRAQTYDNFQVYLIDNASSYDSSNYLKNSYPEAVVLPRLDGNYCAANNLGMNQAILDACDYLVAANMDTEFEANWLKELVAALDNNPKAALAQSLILLAPKTEAEKIDPLVNTTGNLIHFLFFGFTSSYRLKQSALKVENYSEIFYASGCSFIIRPEIFQEIGGYNEDYYMYHDDLDLSLKVRLAGYKVILAAKSLVWHKYEFERSVRMLYFMERNRLLSFFSFYPYWQIIVLSPFIVAMNLGMTLLAIKGSWLTTKLKVDAYFLKPAAWRLISKNRRQLKAITRVPLKSISRTFVGRIEFQEIDNPLLKYFVNPVFNFFWQLIK
ncbi:MAG: glycosyltransferase family 2 protein [Candidatus Falkowbacteria bacterium]